MLLGLLIGFDIILFDILKIIIFVILIGVLVGVFFLKKVGKELLEDFEYLCCLEVGMIDIKYVELNDVKNMFYVCILVIIFIVVMLLIVLFGFIFVMCFVFNGMVLDMLVIIEILMLCVVVVIFFILCMDGIKVI